MSDPAKSADEIEDVLASIRRLVSESGVTGPRAVPSAAPDKLVLTPAQRVSEPDDPWAPVSPTADTAAEPEVDGHDDDPTWGLEDRLSDWGEIEESADEAVADAIAEEAIEELGHFNVPDMANAPTTTEDAFDLAGLAQLDGVIDGEGGGDAFEPETGDTNWPDRGADSALRDLAAARSGQAGAAATNADAEAAETEIADDRTSVEPSAQATSAEADAAEPADQVTAPTDADTDPQSEPDMIDTQTEEAGEDSRAERGFTPVFSRRMEANSAAATAEADDDIEDLGEAPSPFTFPDTDESILDEETLREIVAEVVRQELQGALGQRITRNVRKMVRREIRIALAAEDLE